MSLVPYKQINIVDAMSRKSGVPDHFISENPKWLRHDQEVHERLPSAVTWQFLKLEQLLHCNLHAMFSSGYFWMAVYYVILDSSSSENVCMGNLRIVWHKPRIISQMPRSAPLLGLSIQLCLHFLVLAICFTAVELHIVTKAESK